MEHGELPDILQSQSGIGPSSFLTIVAAAHINCANRKSQALAGAMAMIATGVVLNIRQSVPSPSTMRIPAIGAAFRHG